jgi:hypothetical protein
MMHARGAIELVDDRRELDPDPPLVLAPSGGCECLPPAVPPGGHESGDRLDNQDRTSVCRAVEQTGQERVATSVGELVHGECGKNRCRRKPRDGDIDAACSSREAERTIGPGRLGQRPWMQIEPDEVRPAAADYRPRCPGGTDSASEIDQGGGRGRRPGQPAHDLANQQVVKRAVEERKGRALAGAGEGSTSNQPVAPLDVRRGQRAERARDFRKREVREVPRLEFADPPVEAFVGNAVMLHPRPPTMM